MNWRSCICFTGFALYGYTCINAQDLERMLKGPLFDMSGQLSVNQTYYSVQGREASRKPFNWLLAGNLQIKIAGLPDAPFTFFLSNQGAGYTQPGFNQVAWHPSWKWVKLHAGDISMSWSPYTLNGHLMRGAGAELSPGKWKISAIRGRLVRAVQNAEPAPDRDASNAYRRTGSGFHALYAPGAGREIGLQVFHARDAFTGYLPAGNDPVENVCAGLQLGFPLPFQMAFKVHSAISLMDENLANDSLKFITDRNLAKYKAIKFRAEKKLSGNLLTLEYERVDPGYRTLGAYYFNNDLENIGLGTTVNLPGCRLNFTAFAGVQRSDLYGMRSGGMNRTATRFQGSWTPSGKWQIHGNYSNFLSYTNARQMNENHAVSLFYIQRDSQNYRQVSDNGNLGAQWRIRTDSLKSLNVNWMFSAQRSSDMAAGQANAESLFLNGTLACQQQVVKTAFRLGASVSFSAIQSGLIKNYQFSPAFQSGGRLGKKTRTWSVYSIYTRGSAERMRVVQLRAGIVDQWNKFQKISVSLAVLGGSSTTRQYHEYSIALQYVLALSGLTGSGGAAN